MKKTNTSFIYPEIASLIEAKEEVRQLIEETKTATSHVHDREELILSELESMSARINSITDEYAKIMRLIKIAFTASFLLIVISMAMKFI